MVPLAARLSSRTTVVLLYFAGSYFIGRCWLVFCAQAQPTSNNTPNHRLLQATTVDDLKAALSDGADVNAKDDRSGQTALMAATLRGHYELVEYLLAQAGADPSIGERDGYTPPHGAGFQGRARIMQLLMRHGLDVNEFHADGYAPLHRACWGGEPRHAETVRYLLEAGTPVNLRGGPNRLTCLEMTPNPLTEDLLLQFDSAKEDL